VFELLQNAEDQNAKRVRFELGTDRLVFTHDGDPFTRDNVVSITGIGNSDKPAQANKIGRFGIGFKSVFAVSDRPEVYSHLAGNLSRSRSKIWWCRSAGPVVGRRGGRNPVRHPTQGSRPGSDPQTIRDACRPRCHTLLFLDYIATVDGSRTRRRAVTPVIVRPHPTGATGSPCCRRGRRAAEVAYVVYSQDVTIPEADRPLNVRIAFRLNDHGQVVPEDQGTKLFVYFETEESTGLRFRVHGHSC